MRKTLMAGKTKEKLPTKREIEKMDNKTFYDYCSEGMMKFCILHKDSRCYTIIGAKNIHHACNKATKLWKDGWNGVVEGIPKKTNWKFVPVVDFKLVNKNV